jgi:hypothetical protein
LYPQARQALDRAVLEGKKSPVPEYGRSKNGKPGARWKSCNEVIGSSF